MQEILQQRQAVINAPRVGKSLTIALSGHYACKSVTTGTGLRRHTITTHDKALAFRLLAVVFDVDDLPDFTATRGVFFIQFFANDVECNAVLDAATGVTQ